VDGKESDGSVEAGPDAEHFIRESLTHFSDAPKVEHDLLEAVESRQQPLRQSPRNEAVANREQPHQDAGLRKPEVLGALPVLDFPDARASQPHIVNIMGDQRQPSGANRQRGRPGPPSIMSMFDDSGRRPR